MSSEEQIDLKSSETPGMKSEVKIEPEDDCVNLDTNDFQESVKCLEDIIRSSSPGDFQEKPPSAAILRNLPDIDIPDKPSGLNPSTSPLCSNSLNDNGDHKKKCSSDVIVKNLPVDTLEQPSGSNPSIQPLDAEKTLDFNNEISKLNPDNETEENKNHQEITTLKRGNSESEHKSRIALVEENKVHTLIVIYLPLSWTQVEIKEFVENECGPVTNISMAMDSDTEFIGVVELQYNNFEDCEKAKEILNHKEVEGKRLHAYYVMKDESFDQEQATDSETSEPQVKKMRMEKEESGSSLKEQINVEPWRPDLDIWSIDPLGLYGLKPEFLRRLNITPPIGKWVYVTNFRCDKSELREVMELAGQVVICTVMHAVKKTARVMYSHPLEAVQAVSMLNNQQYYGTPLVVKIESQNFKQTLIKGLSSVGPGLGLYGTPLREVVREYKKYVKGNTSLVNSQIFRKPDDKFTADDDPFSPKQDVDTSSDNQISLIHESDHSQDSFKPQNMHPIPTQNIPNKPMQSMELVPAQHIFNRPVSFQSLPIHNIPIRQPTVNAFPARNIPYRPVPPPPQYNLINLPLQSNSGQNLPSRSLNQNAPIRQPPMQSISNRMPTVQPIQGQNFSRPQPMNSLALKNVFNQAGAINAFKHQGPQSPVLPRINTGPSNAAIARPKASTIPIGQKQTFDGPTGPKSSPGFVSIELTNLPLNTTFPLLSEKMAECGPVMSLQLTAPGCAVVQFSHRSYAEICFRILFLRFTRAY